MRATPVLICLLPVLFAQTTAPSTQPATAPATVDNPMYAVWAKAAPGTALTCAATTTRGDEARPQPVLVFTLVNIAPDAATLEYGPADRPQSRRKLSVPAKVAPGEEALFFLLDRRSRMAVKSTAQTPERVTVDGKPVDATCYATDFDGDNGPDRAPSSITIKAWFAPSQPCPFIKLEMSDTTPDRPQRLSTLTATSFASPATAPASQPQP